MIRKRDILNDIKIASPCPASWEQMEGGDQVRFCSLCKLNVYNLSGMSRSEAEQVVRNAQGRLCVRFYQRADGTMLTRDCPVGLRAIRRRMAFALSWAFVLLLGLRSFADQWSRSPAGTGPARTQRERLREVIGDREPFKSILDRLDPPATTGDVAISPPTMGKRMVMLGAMAPPPSTLPSPSSGTHKP